MREDPEDRSPLESIACLVHEKIPEVPWTFGKAESNEHGAVRRYAWVPYESPIQKSKQAGPREVVDFDEHETPTGILATSTWTIAETVHVKVYGESFGVMSRMVRNLIAVATNTFGPGFRPDRVMWGEEDSKTGRNQLGVLRCSFLVSVVDECFKPRPIAAYTDVCGTLQDDGTLKPQD